MNRLDGKVALVTGAGGGIGKTIAHAMAVTGARVGVLDIEREWANSVTTEIKREGGEAVSICADVSRKDQVSAGVHACANRWGRLDILVNNAAVIGDREDLLVDVEEADWDRVMAVNVKGPFLCIQAAAPLLRSSGGGSIINVTSIGGHLCYPRRRAYGVSKAALENLTMQAAVELGPWNIRVNSVSPGWFRTRMTEYAYSKPEELERRSGTVPLKRIGDPWDIAHLVVFLSSDESEYISGASIEVDGGLLAAALKSTFDLARIRPLEQQ
ncbi:MAG: SDR family NAD(P)-dependent oxidoreductase [Dehalococcoidia bacterium]